MRVTNAMMSQQLLTNLNDIENRMLKSQNDLTTGTRIHLPEDDPVATEADLRIGSTLNNVNKWVSNANDASALMNTMDGSLGLVSNTITTVRTLAVQAANGTLTGGGSSSDLNAIADQVDQMTQYLGSIANTQYNGQYVFAGNSTAQPWDSTTSTWNAPATVTSLKYEIGPGVTIDVGIDGSNLFTGNQTGALVPAAGSGSNGLGGVLGAMQQLSHDLRSNDSAAISNDIALFDQQLSNVNKTRADLGSRENRVQSALNQYQLISTNLKAQQSNAVDADIAKTITDLTQQQTVYQAALNVGMKMIMPTLADLLK